MEVIQLLEYLISIDSSNPFICSRSGDDEWIIEGNETGITEFLVNYMTDGGFKVHRQPVHQDSNGNQYYNVLAEKGDGDQSILFYAHMDTVTTNPWLSEKHALTPRHEFRKHREKEIEVIVGLGSCDMKAGLAVIANAFRDFEPKGYKIKVAFGVDEEFYSLGANVLAESDFLDDVIAILVPEIDDGPNASFGHQVITLGRLGRCEFNIKVAGTGGHGAQAGHPEYISAASQSAKIVNYIEKENCSFRDRFEFSNHHENQHLSSNEIGGSFYVNKLKSGDGSLSIPSKGEVTVSFSCTPNQSFINAQKMIEGLIKEMEKNGVLRKTFVSGKYIPVIVEPKWRPTPPSESYCIPYDHPFTVFTKEIIEKEVGFKGFNMGYSVADENVFARLKTGVPILVVGPVGDNYHRADEWVSVESVKTLEKLYRTIGSKIRQYIVNF